MGIRARRYFAMALVAALIAWAAGHAWAISFGLRETKDELKLDYDVTVQDHGTGRVTIVLTLADEGRLKPLDEVQLAIPAREKSEDGGHWMDLVVSIKMRETDDGKRVGRIHLLRDLAERAEIQLNTHTMDGATDPMTGLYHVISVASYLPNAPAASAAATPPAERRVAPSATERNDE